MLDPAQKLLTREVLDWIDRPAFTLERDSRGDLVYADCNAAYAAIAGAPGATILGQPLTVGFALGEAEKIIPYAETVFQQGRRIVAGEVVRWASGWLCHGITMAPLRADASRQVTGCFVFAGATSPDQLHQAALQVAERKVRDFTELATDWFWESDQEHRISWVSESSDRPVELLRQHFLGHRRWEVPGAEQADPDFWKEHRQQLDRHEPFARLCYRAVIKGQEFWLEVSGKPVFDAAGEFRGYRGASRNITEQYQQQRRIEEALRRAEEASRAKSQFLANMSHELRTPLNAIIGFSEIIRDQMFGPVGLPRYVDYARDINASGTHLLALIGDILDMSRIEAGYYALDEKNVDLAELINSALTMVRPQADRAGAILRNLCPTSLPELKADERVVKQVLINLLGNAVKFTPSGGTIDVVYRQADDAGLTLAVVDSGSGIAPERLEQIFEPFQLAKAEVARQHGGTGLGLSISKRLMELHGGSLTLRSELGKGTTAIISFPAWRLLDDVDQNWQSLAMSAAAETAPAERAEAGITPTDHLGLGVAGGETLQSLLDVMGEGVITIDERGIILAVSAVGAAIFGYDAEELLGRNVQILMPEPFRSGHDSYIKNYLTTKRPKVLRLARDTLGRKKSGEIFPINLCIGEFHMDGASAFVGVVRDISDRRDVELKAEYASRNDPLTGILNRSSFIAEAERLLASRAKVEPGAWVLFNLDIDAFRDVNEGFGFHIGDLVLKTVAERLGESLPREAMVGRIAADQYAAIAAVPDLNNALNLAQALHAHLALPIQADGRLVSVKISIGAVLMDDPAEKIGDVLAKAELAQKLVRNSGGDSTCFYSPEMTRAAERRLRLTMNLQAAIQNEELFLVYQPVVEANSGAIASIEALIRWQHPELGLVSPGEFIPLAEETGAIVAITRWVIQHVAQQVRAWRADGIPPRRVFINVSGQQFVRDDLPAYFRNMAQTDPDLVKFIGIELTEQAAIQNMEQTVRAISDLAAIGVDAALDDFGTGYSSLSYIQRLPIRKIKLDRAFIKDLPGNDKDVALVRAMVGMARGLDLPVVAEGVETQEQRDFLRGVGCSELQGYLISHPVRADEMGEMLRRNDRRRG